MMAALRHGKTTIRFWVTSLFCLIILLFIYYIASDRFTPMTRDAYVQAAVIPVAPQVPGEVVEVLVEEGAKVKVGDPLFRIDPEAYQIEVDRLQAKLDHAELALNQQGTTDWERAELRQIKSMLAKANLSLSQTTVRAPAGGLVDNLQLHTGAYATVGRAVMTLVDAENWWIVANFEENALSVIRDGQKVEFGLYLYPGQVFAGRVESIGWGVERGQGIASGRLPQVGNPSRWVSFSQRFQVRITPEGPVAGQPLRVGATARVVVFSGDQGLMNLLAQWLIRLSATTDYLY
ncbi:HlyD family secretion protein [Ruegeria sp. 2012CJ41-6]|uniref:HlyD family secretion protein n=1 Tax=Ruegeria spongiae TaxID=2942209 RepID=A0ABT0Q6U9_9RHOB|nr:HlyD family secretion protein [Ruegeria spongiae]MCL6285595.1 HlyD family secretion protein [Ruegeria spongiae]